MRLVVLSDERMPAGPDSDGGMARSVWDLADGLAARGHDVTLVGAPGSVFERGTLLLRGAAIPPADAILDGTHAHALSANRPDLPVINRIGDRECAWQPPNMTTETRYMQAHYPAARIIPLGMRDEAAEHFRATPGAYLAFLALNVAHKGLETARQVAARAGIPLREHGSGTAGGVVHGEEKWAFLAGALAVLYPSAIDSSPRVPLEAALLGTPTICLDVDGTQEHVAHCVSGFVCEDAGEMVEAVRDARLLGRAAIRAWALEEHSLDRMLNEYEAALARVAEGDRW